MEMLERREVFSGLSFGTVADPDDQISEAVELGDLSTQRSRAGVIDDGYDVDMFSFTAQAGDTVEIEVAPSAGSNLSSRVRLFGAFLGRANQPLGNGIGSLRFQISNSGTFYVGVSELGNEFYNPVTGNADLNDPTPTSGGYRLVVKSDRSGPPTEGVSEAAADLAEIAVRFTDLSGNTMDSVAVGDEFQIAVSIQDLRQMGEDKGAFGAILDVAYDTSLIDVIEIVHASPFTIFTSGVIDDLAGIIDDVGGLNGIEQPVSRDPQIVFTLKAVATAEGDLLVGTDVGENPVIFNLLYGIDGDVADSIRFRAASRPIHEAESPDTNSCRPYHNCELPEDVNGDGVVAPIDALQVINHLNSSVAPTLSGDGKPYIDVSGDGSVSPIDALLVINYLNGRQGGASDSVSAIPSTSTTPNVPTTSTPSTRIPRNPSTPGAARGNCALSPVGIALGATCNSSSSTSPSGTGSGTALSRVGQLLLGHSSTASAAYASTVDQALVELLAAAI